MYASQRQRKFEREIRALKRELHACEDIGDVEKAKQLTGKIREVTAEYKQFGDAVGLRAKTERIRVTELVANKIHVAEGTRAGLRRLGMVSNECVPFIETEFGGLSSSVVFCTEERM